MGQGEALTAAEALVEAAQGQVDQLRGQPFQIPDQAAPLVLLRRAPVDDRTQVDANGDAFDARVGREGDLALQHIAPGNVAGRNITGLGAAEVERGCAGAEPGEQAIALFGRERLETGEQIVGHRLAVWWEVATPPDGRGGGRYWPGGAARSLAHRAWTWSRSLAGLPPTGPWRCRMPRQGRGKIRSSGKRWAAHTRKPLLLSWLSLSG